MRPNAIGKIQREGISLLGLAAISPDDEVAAKWICTNEHQGDQGLPVTKWSSTQSASG